MSLVNTILLQICKNFIGEVAEFFNEGQIRSLEEIEDHLKRVCNEYILEMVKTYFEILDKTLVEDKQGRKRKGLVIERKGDKRETYIRFGLLKFERTYFKDKKNKGYVYLLDQAVGLESYERVSKSVAVDLVRHANEVSYGKSSRYVSGGEISRQTVMNKVRHLKKLKKEQPETRRQVRVLHVEADEDHVTLQDGTNTIVPLISIHEGVERNGMRGKCKNIHHISDYGKSPEELWLEAANWIYKAYNVDYVERIYLHGDGAAWIKEGLNWLPKSKMVLDRYHLNRAIVAATGNQPEHRKEIYSSILQGNREQFKAIIKQMNLKAVTPNEKKRIAELRKYVLNNWAAIVIYSEEACSGSCTEGHVSHVLSSRLSSRPMSWSRKGLQVMAQLRAYCSSGGQVKSEHLKKTESPYKLSKKVLAKAGRAFKSIAIEQLDNITLLNRGKNVPYFKPLKVIVDGTSII
jgi:hypothetical protein